MSYNGTRQLICLEHKQKYSHLEIRITGLKFVDRDITLIKILTTKIFLIVKIFLTINHVIIVNLHSPI